MSRAAGAGSRQTPRPALPSPLGLQLHWTLANRPLMVLMASKIAVYSGISAFTASSIASRDIPPSGHMPSG